MGIARQTESQHCAGEPDAVSITAKHDYPGITFDAGRGL
jgi:hypothetical protein